MSFPEMSTRVPELESVPDVICDACGANWAVEPCDVGCPNDLDTTSRLEAEETRDPGDAVYP